MPMPAQSGHDADASTNTALYERSGAAVYGMGAEQFAAILDEILRKYFVHNAADPSEEQKAAFCAALRLEELALARACAAGNERAWQDFISRYRQKLRSMAMHITRDGAHAAELADSLYADLYGVNTRDGVRNSKLVFYTGRGSLEGWLRTVMAQEFINRYRKHKHTVSLDEQTEEGVQFAAAVPVPVSPTDQRLEAATDEALAELSSEDRFTLASVLSRRTDTGRDRAHPRAARIERKPAAGSAGNWATEANSGGLRTQGMSHAQAAEALETDVRDIQLNLRSRLMQDSASKPFPGSRKVPGRDPGDGGQ